MIYSGLDTFEILLKYIIISVRYENIKGKQEEISVFICLVLSGLVTRRMMFKGNYINIFLFS